jgi:hypothetical protein
VPDFEAVFNTQFAPFQVSPEVRQAIRTALRDEIQAAVDPHGHARTDAACTALLQADAVTEDLVHHRHIAPASLLTWSADAPSLVALPQRLGTVWSIPVPFRQDLKFSADVFYCRSMANRLVWKLLLNEELGERCPCEGCPCAPTALHLLRENHLPGIEVPLFDEACFPGTNRVCNPWTLQAHRYLVRNLKQVMCALGKGGPGFRQPPKGWVSVASYLGSPECLPFPAKKLDRWRNRLFKSSFTVTTPDDVGAMIFKGEEDMDLRWQPGEEMQEDASLDHPPHQEDRKREDQNQQSANDKMGKGKQMSVEDEYFIGLGLETCAVPPDGNCMIHALRLLGLYLRADETRRLIYQYAEEVLGHLQQAVGIDLVSEVRRATQAGIGLGYDAEGELDRGDMNEEAWLDHNALFVLARTLGVRVDVYVRAVRDGETEVHHQTVNQTGEDGGYKLYLRSGHFEPLVTSSRS